MSGAAEETTTVLENDEPPSYLVLAGESERPLVLACDHASNRVPRSLNGLGLDRTDLERHIAWDIGAGAVAKLLSEKLSAVAVLGNYSRLVIDLNRDLHDPTAFPVVTDGTLVPANVGLSVEARAERARTFFKPYHEALRRELQQRTTPDRLPVLVSIHSFTPVQYGVARPWHVGILWDKDPRLAISLIDALREPGDIVVGDNEPYSGRHPADYTIDHHAETLGLAYAAIEIRQDLLENESGQLRWATRFAELLERSLEDESLYRPTMPGQR